MIKNKSLIPILVLIFHAACAQARIDTLKIDSIRFVSISYSDLDIVLTYNANKYFTGRLSESRNRNEVFSADSFYSDYISHYFSDLNGDGNNELILSVTEGASPYIYNSLLIWDITRSDKPLYRIQNAELDTATFGKPVLTVYIRMSPSLMGLGYNWMLEYRKNKLALFPLTGDKKRYLQPDEVSVLHTMKEFTDSNDPCSDSWYLNFFEYVMIQYKIAGEEKLGEKFFEKHFKCRESNKLLQQIQNSAKDTYLRITDETNYLYGE